MSSELPIRSSRRAATRRKVIVDEEDGSDNETTTTSRQTVEAEDEDEEEFAPAPKASPKRRTTAAAGRKLPSRRTKAAAAEPTETEIEASQIASPPESVAEEPTSPARAAPKRRSVKDARAARQSRVSRASIAPEDALPTPSASSVSSRHSTPLGDITESSINERTPRQTPRPRNTAADGSLIDDATENLVTPKAERQSEEPGEDMTNMTQISHAPPPGTVVKRIDPSITKLERPMDIVVRKRAANVGPATQEPAAPKERMTITYLVLTNFKSYAGRQEVGPFHASFSSVVGPNGSGKSNVIDSLLFVFGFRASKMRQGKISALIHNSADFPDLEYCEVEVHFQMVMDQPGDAAAAVLPESQLVISRRAFKNNSSKYYINGKTSDFTTVTTLLKDRGVDLDHKRFLILQGEVESIAQMKPKAMGDTDDGLLEYLEDIIGTSKYKTPIEEAAGETEALNEVCAEKSGRVQHVEKERNGLEGKKDKALAFIRDENELVLKQAALYQIYLAECGDNALVAEEAIEQIQARLAAELARYGDAEQEVQQAEKVYKAECKLLEKMQKQTKEIIDKADSLDKVMVKIEEKKKHLATKRNKVQKNLDAAEFSIGQAETSSKRAEEDIQRTEGEIAELEEEMAEADEELSRIRESLKGKTQGLSDEIALKQQQLEPWSAKINEKQSARALAQSELDILRERESAGATAVADAETKLRLLAEQREAKVNEIDACEAQQVTAEKDAATARRQLEKIASREPACKAKLSSARQKAEEARASLSATQTQGRVLADLTRLRESGRLEGFHGRLGNLGAIDAKYDVAISTACPALDNLVVDSVEAAQQCIDYLRKNNAGRANFICLDKLATRDLARIDTPEQCPRLFDLVKPKHERFLPAFYHVLQNTLVARDSEQADRVAYGAKRWRVVSLEGKLIDKSGTMSGGGTRVARGAMSSKVAADTSKEQVVKLEQDRDVVEADYNEVQQQQRDLENQVRALETRLPELETQASKLALELGSIDRNIQDGQKRVQELSTEQRTSKLDKGKIAALEKNISVLEKEQDKLKRESEGIEAAIKELQDRIMEIGGVKLRGQKAKVDGLKDQIKSLSETRDTAEIEKAKAEKAIVKHGKAQTEATSELARISEDLAKVEEDVAAQRDTSGNSAVRREAEEAKEALEYKKEEIQELKTALDQQTSELNANRGAEVEMRNQLEDNQKHLAVNQKQHRHWQEKLDKLSLQNFGADGEEQEPEPVPELSRDELQDLDKDELKAGIATLEERTSAHPDLSVLAEYRRRVSEHSSRLEDLNAALTARDSAKKRTDDLRRLRLEGFMEGFSTISLRLKEMYQMITMGGNAELELVDSLDPFSEGILFSVMPPKKSWKNISNLSGGEKTLSSLALVFALHHYKPTPLYVMDEIDAALDFRNVSIVAAYIKERTKNAQFIVISLRNNMFELAARLVGVYKVNHMTKSVTVENKEYITQRA